MEITLVTQMKENANGPDSQNFLYVTMKTQREDEEGQ